jgi:KUP system potassium uptake protein
MVNWALMTMVILLVLVFGSSSNLAAAYGIAVTGAMFIDGCLLAVVLFSLWKWPAWAAVPMLALFFVVDMAYLGANLMKVPAGGWFPLVVGIVAFTFLTTWAKGRKLLAAQMRKTEIPAEDLFGSGVQSLTRVPGTAVYMTSQPDGVPQALRQNMEHNRVVHERSLFVRVEVEDRSLRFARRGGDCRKSRPRILQGDAAPGVHGGDERSQGARALGRNRRAAGSGGNQLLLEPANAAGD